MMLGIWNDDIYISLEGYKRMNARWGDSKLAFKENRSTPLRYLGAFKHPACKEFNQTEKSCVSCCFIVIVSLLATNLWCFNSFLA